MKRVADYIVERLYQEGIQELFLVTGRGLLFLTDAVAKHEKMNVVCTHHEQSATFAASAYAEASDSLGACMVSTGCGSTNAITGVLNAWQDNIPCIVISGQNKLSETTRHTKLPIRTFGNQEADIISLVEPITKYSKMLSDPQDVAYELDKALYLAREGRPGPVWLDVPLDVQNMRVEEDRLRRFEQQEKRIEPAQEDLGYVLKALNDATRPSILIGSGVRSAKAVSQFESLIEKNPLPVTFSNSAVDVYGANNQYSMGMVASIGGTRCGNFVIQNSDLVLVIGCRLSPFLTSSEFDKFARCAKVIVVDIDQVEHSKNTIQIDKFIHSDAKTFLSALNRLELPATNSQWLNKCCHWKKTFPKCEEQFQKGDKIDLHHFSQGISESLGADNTVITDSGLCELIAPSVIEFKKEQRCIHPSSQGSMGYALAGAIGAYYGRRKPVVVIVGDGSIMMNIQELQTISHHNLPIKIFVINNNVYSVIRTRQEDQFRSRTIGTDPSNGVSCPDFKTVAECFKLGYVKITKKEMLTKQLHCVYEMDGPVLCEVMCVEDQRYLHSAYTRNAKKRIVRRPLEDQSPFLPRETFLSEMVVEPIDQ